jgi:hypothetical protein
MRQYSDVSNSEIGNFGANCMVPLCKSRNQKQEELKLNLKEAI